MKKNVLVLAILAVGLLSQEGKAFNIFGKDHRKIPHSQAFPLNLIGKLISSTSNKGSGCTASLVGPDLVLTNLHCISQILANEGTGDISFKLGYDDGSLLAFSLVKSTIAHFTKTPTGISWNKVQDFAILVLKEPLGKKYGWFKVAQGSSEFRGSQVSMAGYSADIRGGAVLSVHDNCHLYDFAQGFVMHDCDSTPGSSGSPIFQVVSATEAVIVALNAGEFTGTQTVKEGSYLTIDKFNEHYSNYAVTNENFIGDINEALAGRR